MNYLTCFKWFRMKQKSASLELPPKPLLDEPQRWREQPGIKMNKTVINKLNNIRLA